MMRSMQRAFWILLLLCGAIAPAHPQSYPDKPIRLVIPYPPGGATDLTGRLLQAKLSQALHQPLVVDNRGGATGAIGTRIVAQSAPDGYTILFTVGTDLALNRILGQDSSVNPETDLTPVIFQESRVVAIGRYPLKKLRRSLCQQRSLASCP